MPDQDAPESRATAAAYAINDQVSQLWLSAHTEGIRDGLELAASLCNDLARDASWTPGKALETARDEIRLLALAVTDPDAPNPGAGR